MPSAYSRDANIVHRPGVTRAALTVAATAVALAAGQQAARADLDGFTNFAPVNSATTGTGNGYFNSGTVFQVTDGAGGQGTSGFATTPQASSNFVTRFTYFATPGTTQMADGLAFVLQNDPRGTAALGGTGGAMGYGAGDNGVAVTNSAAYLLKLFNPTGVVQTTGGVVPGSYALTQGGVSLTAQNPLDVKLSYYGTTLTATFRDTINNNVWTHQSTLNIPAAVGGPTALVGFSGGTGGLTANQSVRDFTFRNVAGPFTPIPVFGFNQDIVVGIAEADPQAGLTATMDNGTAKTAYTVYEKGRNTAAPTTGLSSGTTIVSEADGSHTFALQPATAANALHINAAAPTGTMVLADPMPMKALSFLTSSGNGAATFSARITFAGSAPDEVIEGIAAPDWYNNGGVAVNLNGRISADDGGYDSVNTGNPRLYQQDVVLANQTDPISAITFTHDGLNGQTFIFAVSGVPTLPVPEPASAGCVAAAAAAAGLLRRRRRQSSREV